MTAAPPEQLPAGGVAERARRQVELRDANVDEQRLDVVGVAPERVVVIRLREDSKQFGSCLAISRRP